jgi:hypothetical protein
MADNNEGRDMPWRLISSGVLGALTGHLLIYLVLWAFSFGPTIINALALALMQIAAPLTLGLYAGFLCNRANGAKPFWIGLICMVLSVPLALLISSYFAVPISPNFFINTVARSVSIIGVGLVVVTLMVGFIVTLRRLRPR